MEVYQKVKTLSLHKQQKISFIKCKSIRKKRDCVHSLKINELRDESTKKAGFPKKKKEIIFKPVFCFSSSLYKYAHLEM